MRGAIHWERVVLTWELVWEVHVLELQENGGKKKSVIGFQNEQSSKLYMQLWNAKEAHLNYDLSFIFSY